MNPIPTGQPLCRFRLEQGVPRHGAGGLRLRVPSSSQRLHGAHAARTESGHRQVPDIKAIQKVKLCLIMGID